MFLQWIVTAICRLYRGGVNQRNPLTLALNFCMGFAPVFIWLFIFKNAGLIPTRIRPRIHNKLAFLADQFMFGDFRGELLLQYGNNDTARAARQATVFTASTFMLLLLIVVPLAAWYYIYYHRKVTFNIVDWYDREFHGRDQFRPTNPRILLPFLFPLYVYVMLNIDSVFTWQDESNFTKFKDILAWFSYVLLHLLAPIFTAVYLYVFHPPGTLKAFSLALGLQNICGVFTHLLLPMAPPWFIHMYGIQDTEHVTYEQPGYAAGLTRVDTHLGTHLNSNGFHKSPIVFGAVPSLHSAMAVQCFLFLLTRATTTKNRNMIGQSTCKIGFDAEADREDKDAEALELESLSNSLDSSETPLVESRSPAAQCVPNNSKWLFIFHKAILPRTLGTAFPILQWWSTMYLDHHYRFDLLVGMCYAIVSFMIISTFYLQRRVLKRWCDVRLGKVEDVRHEGKTMGMRVFENTSFEWFFDPFA